MAVKHTDRQTDGHLPSLYVDKPPRKVALKIGYKKFHMPPWGLLYTMHCSTYSKGAYLKWEFDPFLEGSYF